MKNRIRITTLGLLLSLVAAAQTKQEQQAIQQLCGCFEVSFKYAETFSKDTGYQHAKPYYAKGLEWVVAEENTDRKMVLQHLLVVQDSMIVKHWREDWEYEKKEWWAFDKEATWKKKLMPTDQVRGTWVQTVWEVDDAPRYQGVSKWISNNGQYYWENRADAPLPRREYTKRNDYNVMQRGNRIIVSNEEWIHEQDNKKLLRKTGEADVLIAEEKGYNIYTRTDDAKCKAAKDWWAQHRGFWNAVRRQWDAALVEKQTIQLVPRVGTQSLDRSLSQIEKLALKGAAQDAAIREALIKFAK